MTTKEKREQMSADQFIGEVIQIGKLLEFTLKTYDKRIVHENMKCSCKVCLRVPIAGTWINYTFRGDGKTVGYAMLACRRRIKHDLGM